MTERENFDAAMQKILSVSKEELQRRMEAAAVKKSRRPAVKSIERRVAKHLRRSSRRAPASS